MSLAIFFVRHPKFSLLKRIYIKFCLKNNNKKVRYLRDLGAKIGENTFVGSISTFGTEPYLIEVGNNVYFSGESTQLITHDGAVMQLMYMGYTPKKMDIFGRIKIGDNCFIGTNSIILKNVVIGKNCIIGAGSIVTKNIPDGSVACGVPAKVVGTVEDFYKKNSENFFDTYGWSFAEKRRYLEVFFKQKNNVN